MRGRTAAAARVRTRQRHRDRLGKCPAGRLDPRRRRRGVLLGRRLVPTSAGTDHLQEEQRRDRFERPTRFPHHAQLPTQKRRAESHSRESVGKRPRGHSSPTRDASRGCLESSVSPALRSDATWASAAPESEAWEFPGGPCFRWFRRYGTVAPAPSPRIRVPLELPR
ncbi:hypothetical protein DB31_1228 [Hyalangium minutum]|uniref:Uncharacterized protein n=1 Tax=Hyalangium minutum TaxID=394096 RepID=A0A085WEQ0_9BACT|nr:hypothetical protein DB31_1228 [Hyalangium minutum]